MDDVNNAIIGAPLSSLASDERQQAEKDHDAQMHMSPEDWKHFLNIRNRVREITGFKEVNVQVLTAKKAYTGRYEGMDYADLYLASSDGLVRRAEAVPIKEITELLH